MHFRHKQKKINSYKPTQCTLDICCQLIIFHFKKATDCPDPTVHTSCSSRLCLRAAWCLITPHSLYVGGCAVVAPKGQLPPRLYFWVLHREASQTLISPACQLLWSSILGPSMLQCSSIMALGRATAQFKVCPSRLALSQDSAMEKWQRGSGNSYACQSTGFSCR